MSRQIGTYATLNDEKTVCTFLGDPLQIRRSVQEADGREDLHAALVTMDDVRHELSLERGAVQNHIRYQQRSPSAAPWRHCVAKLSRPAGDMADHVNDLVELALWGGGNDGTTNTFADNGSTVTFLGRTLNVTTRVNGSVEAVEVVGPLTRRLRLRVDGAAPDGTRTLSYEMHQGNGSFTAAVKRTFAQATVAQLMNALITQVIRGMGRYQQP